MMNGDDNWLLKLSMMIDDHLWWLMHLYNEIITKLRMVSVHHISSTSISPLAMTCLPQELVPGETLGIF